MRNPIIFSFLLLSGCATVAIVTDADRQVADQTEKAGRHVKETAPVDRPDLKQAGSDVEANAVTLKRNVTGEPKNPVPYSPENSAGFRASSDKGHEAIGGVLDTVWGGAKTAFPWLLPLLTAAGGALTVARKYKPQIENSYTLFRNTVEGIQSVVPSEYKSKIISEVTKNISSNHPISILHKRIKELKSKQISTS